jgi:AhpD family alkylhydroperoxidase
MMTSRLDPFTVAPAEMKAWCDASLKVAPALEASLLELVKIRASQINGCANCLNMHAAAARKAGETEQRIYLLSAWQEAPCYTPRERAALAWTDALTRVATERAPDSLYAALAQQFTANVMNGWNRLAVGFNLFYDAKPVAAAA